MLQSGTDTWLLPESLAIRDLLDALRTEFDTSTNQEYATTVVYADTFDWRLYQQGYILRCQDRTWTLVNDDLHEVAFAENGPELGQACSAREFPTGRLRDLLSPLIGIRSLLPLATVNLKGMLIRLLNKDEKTVARLVVEEQSTPTSPGAPCIHLASVRGYDREAAAVRRVLAAKGIVQAVSPLSGFHLGCRTAGRTPLDYTSKFAIDLDEESTARQAMVQIYLALLAQIRRNIPGAMHDLDSEFLHDLRVAIRRTRSGLSLVKQVMAPDAVLKFKKSFSQLGSLTGPTRDLDVYLLKEEEYLALLPESLRPGLVEFFTGLATRRRVEQAKLARALRAKKHKAMLASWQQYLESEESTPAPRAGMPVRELANRIIHRHFRHVLEEGGTLDASTPDSDVHRLRIQCKKLRYAMEFFSSLYTRDAIGQLVRQLKKLQDILGTFNDLSVQQLMLRHSLDGLGGGACRRNLDMAAALGGLMQSLYQQQQELRTHFAEVFTQFSDPATIALVDELFRKKQESS